MNAITSWYKNLNQREKPMVNLLAAMLVIFLIYFVLVSPLASYQNQLEEDQEYFSDSLATVSMQVQALASNKGSAPPNSRQTLNQLVTQSSGRYGLKLKNISEPKKNQTIQVRLDEAEFNQVLRWVVTLENQHGLIVDTLRVSDTDDIGRVDVSLKITRI